MDAHPRLRGGRAFRDPQVVQLPESAPELIESDALAHLARISPELLQRLAHTHLGPDVRFPPMEDPPAGHVTE